MALEGCRAIDLMLHLKLAYCYVTRSISVILADISDMQEYTGKLATVQAKGDDYEIAAAQIGVEVYSAMSNAVGA